jgi:hypothetical protein
MPGTIGQIQKNYVSSVNFLDQREILNKILDVTNEESSFLDVMELTGRSEVTSVPEYHHFVNEELYVLGTVTSGGATPGDTLTLVIDADAFAFVNLGELVLFPSGKVGIVTAKNSGTSAITVKNVDDADGSLNVADGGKIAFFSNAAGEGSESPAAKRWKPTKYANQVQIFKGKFSITDIQKASKIETEFNGKPFYMYKGQHESLLKFRGDISLAAWFSRKSATKFSDANPALVDAEGKPIQTTMGVDQYVTSMGKDLTTDVTGVLDLDDWAKLTQTLNKDRAPLQYFLFTGTSSNILLDNLFNNLGNSALLSQGARFQIAGKELDLGIDTIKIYGRTFYKKYLPLLDHKNILNFTGGYNAKDSIYGIPADKIKTQDGQMVDRLRMRYMAGDGTDLKYREILTGGLAPVPTDDRSVLNISYESVQGVEILGAQQTFKLKTVF